MDSPSHAQINSDAEPSELLSSYAITPGSSASVHSDVTPDAQLVDIELACRRQQATDHSKVETISYEEALERELEYQKRVKRTLQQPPIVSASLSTPSAELHTEPRPAGIKRKLASGSILDPVPHGVRDKKLPPQHLQVPQFASIQHQQTSAQGPTYRHPLPQHSLNRQPLPHQSQGLQPPLWCNICKVNCATPFNLKKHRLGKKHKAATELVYGSKKTTPNGNEILWCKDCNVPCTNEMALAQHCAGKKHAARLEALALQTQTSARGAGVSLEPFRYSQ